VAEEIGESLLALRRDAKAAPHFSEACRLLSTDDWLKVEEPEQLERMKKLAGASLETD
tara:strand:- start:518 stop:691 length:174 start_codon:yes stop_codon:yes gene_type:complete